MLEKLLALPCRIDESLLRLLMLWFRCSLKRRDSSFLEETECRSSMQLLSLLISFWAVFEDF